MILRLAVDLICWVLSHPRHALPTQRPLTAEQEMHRRIDELERHFRKVAAS